MQTNTFTALNAAAFSFFFQEHCMAQKHLKDLFYLWKDLMEHD
jgi:hypothetical protein